MRNEKALEYRIILIDDYSVKEMIETVKKLMNYSEKNQLDAIVLEPHPHTEEYIRKNSPHIDSMELHKTGHAIMIFRYCKFKNLPIFCFSKKTIDKDIYEIKKEIYAKDYKYLASIISKKSEKDFIKKFFSKLF